MNKKDIDLLCKILTIQNQNDLVSIISSGFGLLEESDSYGSYWNSTISSYTIFLEIKKYFEAKEISEKNKNIILDALLEIYPHKDASPEIISVDFQLLKELPEGFSEEDYLINQDDLISFEHETSVKCKFLIDQIKKAESKYKNGDLDGSLTNIRTTIEAATFDIYKRITDEDIIGTGSLQNDYKKVKQLLNLAPENKTNISAKKMASALITAIDSIDDLSNQMGDRHLKKVSADPHHVAFCLNASKTILNFLYSSLIYQYKNKNSIYIEILKLLNKDDNRFKTKNKLLEIKEISFIYMRCDIFTQNLLKTKLVSEFEITNFRKSDIFFAFLDLFSEILSKEDINLINKKHKHNSQACGLEGFMKKHSGKINV